MNTATGIEDDRGALAAKVSQPHVSPREFAIQGKKC